MRAHHTLLERDDRVVGDVNVLRANLGAALGDVAEAEAVRRANEIDALVRVERVHLERGEAHEEPRPGEALLVLFVVADDVADILAEEALDALVEFLNALDVLLVHPPLAVGVLRLRLERGDGLRLLVVERDVGDKVLDHWERLHRRDRDVLSGWELIHARHAHELRMPVHLGAARTAFACLAVPAHRKVRSVLGLDAMYHVEYDHALVRRDLVRHEVAAGSVAAPDPDLNHGHQSSPAATGVFAPVAATPEGLSSPRSALSSAGTLGMGSVVITRRPSRFRVTTFLVPHSGSAFGKSSRVCPPRLSSRIRALRVTASETPIRFSRSSARCHPGLYTREPTTRARVARPRSRSSRASASSSSSRRRMIPTSSCIVSCSSEWIAYGFSSPAFSKGAVSRCANALTCVSSIFGARARLLYWAAASPARRPKTRRSESELPPRRFAPCMPAATSPAA